MSVLDNFEDWKGFLGKRLQKMESKGMDEKTVDHMATQVGDYLASHVDPKNNEQRLLSDLWHAADDEEKEALASSMVNMVRNSK